MAHVPGLSPRALRRLAGAFNALGLLLLVFFLGVVAAQAQTCGPPVTKDQTGWEWDCLVAAPSKNATVQTDAASAQAGITACTADYDSTTANHVGGVSESAVCMASNADGCYQYKWTYGTHFDSNNGYAGMGTFTLFRAQVAADCAPAFDCTGKQGESHYQSYEGVGIGFTIPTVACIDLGVPGESCMAVQKGSSICLGDTGGCVAKYEVNGAACTQAPESPQAWEGERCETLAGGVEFCSTPNSQEASCGWVNDQYRCLEKTYPDGCQVLPDGSRICGSAAPSPPAPDNGTPGTKATPDDNIKTVDADGQGRDRDLDVFGQATSAASSRDPGDGSNPGGTTGEGGSGGSAHSGSSDGPEDGKTSAYCTANPEKCDGSGPGDGYAAGSASGGLTCDSPPVCSHDDPVQCAQLRQMWEIRCSGGSGNYDGDTTENDVLGAMGATTAERAGDLSHGQTGQDISAYLDADGGYAAPACPAPLVVSMFGQSMSFDLWAYACQFALAFAPFTMVMGYLSAASILVKGIRK